MKESCFKPPLSNIFYLTKQQMQQIYLRKLMSGTYTIFQYLYIFITFLFFTHLHNVSLASVAHTEAASS